MSGDEEADYLDWRDELADWPETEDPSASARRPALICRCFCVEEQEIEGLIAEGADLAEIARVTGATTGCSGCRRQIQVMLGGP